MDYEKRLCYAPAFVKVAFYGTNDLIKKQFELLLKKQICLVCYKEAKTVKEMSKLLGMDAVYINDAVNELESNKLLKMQGKKYITNFCMIPLVQSDIVYSIKHEYFIQNNFSERIQKFLLDKKQEILDLGFYGNNFDYNFLLWILNYIISSEISMIIRKKYLCGKIDDLNPNNIPYEPFSVKAEYEYAEENNDFEKNSNSKKNKVLIVFSDVTTVDFGECQFYKMINVSSGNANDSNDIDDDFNENGDDYERLLINLKKGYIEHGEISLLLNIVNGKKSFSEREEKSLEIMENSGFVQKEKDEYKCMIPVFTKEQIRRLYEILYDSAADFADEIYEGIGKKIEKQLIPYIRKDDDLLYQFYYYWLVSYMSPTDELFEYCMNNSDLSDNFSDINTPAILVI